MTPAHRRRVCYKRTVPDPRSLAPATAGVLAFCLTVYGLTLYPTVPGGDAGELIAVAHALGVAHPPGYPLWTLLAGAFTLIPYGSIAWRVAWLSAVCTAAASALIFASVASLLATARATQSTGTTGTTVGRADETPGASQTSFIAAQREHGLDAPAIAGGIAGAAFFAFSPTVWAYAVGAEVFPLHSFFTALLLYLALRWSQTREPRVAYAIGATIGLGLTNHLTLIFYALPIAIWLLWSGRNVLWTPRGIAVLLTAGMAGLLPYAYLWIAGSREHPLSWGDTATLRGFADHLLRRDYGTFQLLPDGHAASSSYIEKLGAYVTHFARASLGAGALLAAYATAASIQRGTRERAADGSSQASRRWILLLLACASFYLVMFHALANVAVGDAFLRGVLSRFWMQADVALCILAGVGFGLFCKNMLSAHRAIVWMLTGLVVLVSLGASGGERAGRGGAVVERYGRAIVEPLPPDALLLTHGDLITNVVRYLQSCEELRSDVIVLDQELMTKPWYIRRMARRFPELRFPGTVYHPAMAGGFSMRAFLDANREGRSIFVYPEWKDGDPSIAGSWQAWPEGLASRALPVAASPAPSKWALDSAAGLAALDARGWPPIDRYAAGTWERVALEDVWQARHRRALLLLQQALARNNDAGLLAIARGEFESSARMHPDPPWYLFKNLGLVYDRLAADSPWLRGEQLKAWQRYLATAPAEDADRAAIAAVVRQLEARPALPPSGAGRQRGL